MQSLDFTTQNIKTISNVLNEGKITMLPADTVFGLSALATNKLAVEKIYAIKKRPTHKPLIVLVSSVEEINQFNIEIKPQEKDIINKYWPAPLTVVLECVDSKYSHLHRGHNTIAFRSPKFELLQQVLIKTGPLVSTTVNISGEDPINNIHLAQQTFGNQIDLYVNYEYKTINKPSTVVKLTNQGFELLRQGEVILNH